MFDLDVIRKENRCMEYCIYNMVDNEWNVEIEFKELNMFVLQMEAL